MLKADITAQVAEGVEEVKGVEVCEVKYLKTRTDLSVTIEGKGEIPSFLDAQGDIKLLGLEGVPVTTIQVTVADASSFGRLFNRAIPAFAVLCISLNGGELLDWDADSGVLTVEGTSEVPLIGSDLPVVFELLHRMIRRAKTSMSYTQHHLTLYDLKQACGLIHGKNQGDQDAVDILDWMDPRELITLEAKKEEAKKKAAAKKAAKPKAEKKPKAKPKAEEKTGAGESAPKKKTQAKTPKAGKKAKLSDMVDD